MTRRNRKPEQSHHSPRQNDAAPRNRDCTTEQADFAFATFLLKILDPGTFVRDRPDRASPRKTKKSGDFPARKPGEPSVANVIRRIEFHLLSPHMIT